jgi:hypothetical protein
MPVHRRPLRRGLRCFPDHRNRSAAGGGIGPGGHQHRPQPGVERYSLAQAAADQRVVQSRRSVEIETLRAQAEVEPIKSLAAELAALHQSGANILQSYLRNVRLTLYDKAQQVYMESGR